MQDDGKKPRRWLLKLSLAILLIVVMVLALVLIVLFRGVTLGPHTVAGVSVGHFSLRLERKLHLDISDVVIPRRQPEDSGGSAGKIDPSKLRKLLNTIGVIEKGFAAIDIRQLSFGHLTADFSYRQDGPGHLRAHSPKEGLDLDISMQGDQLLLDIQRLSAPQWGLKASGQVQVDTRQLSLTGTLDARVADSLPLELELEADRKQLSFSGRGRDSVASIEPIVSLFKLSPAISPWISDYLKGSAYRLSSFSGTLPYKHPAKLLQSLQATAEVDDLEYTFAPGLEPARASSAEVVFEQGILHIYPHESSFYGQDGGDTYVDIDFNGGRFVLKVFVRTRAQASGGVLTLLQHYGIPFPLTQLEGLTDTDLNLAIDLKTKQVVTDGRFVATDTVIGFGEQQLAVSDLDIGLKNTVIAFNRLDVALKDQIEARVTGVVDAAAGEGDLDIALDRFDWIPAPSKVGLRAELPQALPLQYHFRAAGDSIELAASRWHYGDIEIDLDAFTTAFDPKTLSGSVEQVGVALQPGVRMQVSGAYRATAPYVDFAIKLLSLKRGPLQLARPAAFDLRVDDAVRVTTPAAIQFALNQQPLTLAPSQLLIKGDTLIVQKSGLTMQAGLSTQVSGQLALSQRRGKFALSELTIGQTPSRPLFAMAQTLPLTLHWGAGDLGVVAPALGLSFKHGANGAWQVSSEDLAKLAKHSPLLQGLKVNSGNLKVGSADGGTPYTFSGRLDYPLGLIVAGDKPIHNYDLSGRYDGTNTQIEINDKVKVKLSAGTGVQIVSHDVGYNLPALFQLIQDQAAASPASGAAGSAGSSSASSGNQWPISLRAGNTFIYLGEKARVLADGLAARYGMGKASVEFYHGAGLGLLQYSDEGLHLVGHDFDQRFINALMSVARFDGGTLEFRASGQVDDLKGALRIEHTTLTGWKNLYNLLAFVNTAPELLTFHLPDYDKKGMPCDEIYAGFSYAGGVLDVQTARLDSGQMDLNGTGSVNLNKKDIDMTINLIGGAHKSLAKVPLLGYVLTGGKKKPSITLTMKGDLANPTIKNTAFKEVASYPFKVVERTVLLPVHMADKIKQNKAAKQQTAPHEKE